MAELRPGIPLTLTELTAAGQSASFSTNGLKSVTVEYTITNINATIQVRLEGSVSKDKFKNLDPSDNDEMHNSNTTDHFFFEGPFEQMRLVFVGETGGTDALINAIVTGLNR